ncbi:PPE domain-containing protein [Lentzea sp. BCCO 10_0061]|uniref:PPE domain-containing protein n=1 Tax=Lentzea sokolovensis TaxID=3095429 RepID=A0ABU4VDT4_9PSEU|nr:PPE domain-containing protein [Lentzea sp. BCCO 10_0061]MDX8149849.1 PPE domain-containing protein [Lentzea sp. BCCO 10_0061]
MAGDEPNIGGFAMLPFAGGETIYKWFENGKGPGQSTSVTSQSWRNLSSGHGDVAQLIEKAVRDSGAAWEGSAGDAARGNTSPLATWATVTGESATQAGTTADTVGSAYVDAKNAMSMPPTVPDKPFLNDWRPWDTDYDKALEKNQQVSEANVRAFNQYAGAVNASMDNQPTFIAPTATEGNLEESKEPPIPPVTPPKYGEPPPIGSNPPGGGGDRNGSDDSQLSSWKPPGSNDDTSTAGVDDRFTPPPTDDGGRRPPPNIGVPNQPPDGVFNPNDPRRPGGPLDPNNPRNRPGGPGGPGGPNGPGGRGLGGPGGGGGAGGGRGGGGLGGPGAGGLGGAAAAKGMGGPGGMGSGFGGASGVAGDGRGGAGGFGPSGAGAAGAGGRGAAGMGAGGMGAGGGRGEGEEDKEHKSASYLQETEDIFGDGTMVAPPVIGG